MSMMTRRAKEVKTVNPPNLTKTLQTAMQGREGQLHTDDGDDDNDNRSDDDTRFRKYDRGGAFRGQSKKGLL